jgi:hypothetical protein
LLAQDNGYGLRYGALDPFSRDLRQDVNRISGFGKLLAAMQRPAAQYR